jgi:calcium/calmodulin-dependent protein kinase I
MLSTVYAPVVSAKLFDDVWEMRKAIKVCPEYELRKCKHKLFKNINSVKIYSKDFLLSINPDNADKYPTKEAVLLSQLCHPNIMRLYEIYEDRVNYYFVMESVLGETIKSHVERYDGITEPRVAIIIAQVLSAVSY